MSAPRPLPAANGDVRRVLIVHGLWLTGAETVLLRRRLRAQGFESTVFRYPSRHGSLDPLLARLEREAAALGGRFHAIGHSLGGVLLLRLLERCPALALARCVLLGAPVHGSRAARRLATLPFGPAVMGPLAVAELTLERNASWRGSAEIGVLSGTLSIGLGRLIADLPVPNDGVVAVDETVVDGAADRIELRVSHSGMLVSVEVARASARFLATGAFGSRDG